MAHKTAVEKLTIASAMDKIAYFFILAALVSADIASESLPPIDGMQRLEVICFNNIQCEVLHSYQDDPDFEFGPKVQGRTEVYVAAHKINNFKQELQKHSIIFNVLIEDVGELVRTQAARQNRKIPNGYYDFGHFPSYNEIKVYLQHLASKYGNFLVQAFSIGKSFEGRDIMGIKIISGVERKPILLIDAGIHAREWIAPTTVLYAIEQFILARTRGYLASNFDIYILPLLNPDGYEYSRSSSKNRLWRKNRSNFGLSCLGADLNRNFGMSWRGAGTSSNPCSSEYAGHGPFSEPETQALRDFFISHGHLIKVHLSMHSYMTGILYPWGPSNTPPPHNIQLLRNLSAEAASAIESYRGTRYVVGRISDVVKGGATGTSVDWSMASGTSYASFAFELPSNAYGFFAPESEIIPIADETFRGLMVFATFVQGASSSSPFLQDERFLSTKPPAFQNESAIQYDRSEGLLIAIPVSK